MRFLTSLWLCLLSLTSIQAEEPRAVLIVHGGAGVLSEAEMKAENLKREDYEKGLADALRAGWKAMNTKGKTATDGVEAAIRAFEDHGLFNAGRGAVLTTDGRAELDAAIMEGLMEGKGIGKSDPRKRAGCVTGLTHVKNPISAARAVMEMEGSKHAFLAGEGAEAFVLNDANRAKYAIERMPGTYFWTERHLKQAKLPEPKKVSGREADRFFGTVGAVAVSQSGHITAGTSTGGLSNKWPGRIGDSPILGAGTYADDRACGVSSTGTGEVFMRHAAAHDIIARMVYGKTDVATAAKETVNALPDEEGGVGGLIALDGKGRFAVAMSPKTNGIYRGYVDVDGNIFVAVYAKDEWKAMGK